MAITTNLNPSFLSPAGSIKQRACLDPYQDLASQVMPTTMRDSLRWAEFIASVNGIYLEALRRIAAYCTTNIDVISNPQAGVDTNKERRERYLEILGPGMLDMLSETVSFSLDLLIYANVYRSVHTKLMRYLTCPVCRSEYPFEVVYNNPSFRFTWQNYSFYATCPHCNKSNNFKVVDRYSKRPEDLWIKRWNPHDITLINGPFTDKAVAVYHIPSSVKRKITSGSFFALRETPLGLIEAVRDSMDFKLDEDAFRHFREEPISGVRSEGWGIPRSIATFRNSWRWQLINRVDEIVASEFMLPIRIFSPPPGGGAGDMKDQQINIGLSNFRQNMKRMLYEHRQDPAAINIAPCAVQYQTTGGDAAQFMPREQVDQTMNTLLSAIGINADMFQGTMQLNSAPVALRLFEAVWSGLRNSQNKFADFVVKRVALLLNDTPVKVQYEKITHADDMNRQYMKQQLMSEGLISKTTGLGSVGINYAEESRRMMEEDKDMAELQQKQQEDMETSQMFQEQIPNVMQMQQQQQQAAAQGGMPPGGGGGMALPMQGGMPMQPGQPTQPGQPPIMPTGGGMPPVTPIQQMIAQWKTLPTANPQEMWQKAQTIAQQIVQMGPEGERASAELKKSDPDIHPMVRTLVTEMKREQQHQGAQMMQQQGMM